MVLLNDEKHKYYSNYIIYEPNRSLFYYPSKYHQNSECQGMSKDNGFGNMQGFCQLLLILQLSFVCGFAHLARRMLSSMVLLQAVLALTLIKETRN